MYTLQGPSLYIASSKQQRPLSLLEKFHFLPNDDPYQQKNPAHVIHAVDTHPRAKFRRRTSSRFGGDR